MPSKQKVAIVGCGWLGQALASYLLKANYYVVGTSQSLEKLEQISVLGAISERLILPLDNADNSQYNCFDCQSLIIAITPQMRSGKTDYHKKIAQIVSKAQQGNVEQIILINSTAIYGGLLGDITEDALLASSQSKVALLQQAENSVLESGISSISLRVAGLVGPDRSPGNFFKQGRLLKDPQAYVNLVHQTDVVQCIARLIRAPEITGIFNIASTMKISKKSYYQQAALSLGKPAPEFETNLGGESKSENTGKFVVSDKIRQALSYQFQYDDLLTWLSKSD
jgi:nucleoside-diphosphate-sugar epimerase